MQDFQLAPTKLVQENLAVVASHDFLALAHMTLVQQVCCSAQNKILFCIEAKESAALAEHLVQLAQHQASVMNASCRQELTWQELQPILLPASPNLEPLKKPKRKLQRADTHMLDVRPKATAGSADADAVPDNAPKQSAARSRQAAKPSKAKGRAAKTASRSQQLLADEGSEVEEAVLAEEPVRADTPAGPRADAGTGPASKPGISITPYSASKKPKALVALGSMHTSEQQACSSQLAKIGVAFVTHKQCSR